MSEKKLCVVGNKLVEGRYKLSAVECRLIMHTISRIGRDDEELKTYEYSGSELVEALGIGEKNNQYLLDVIRGLMKKTVEIRRQKSTLIASWLGGETEIFDDGRLTIRFSEKLKPYLLQLKEQFTPIQFESMMQFKSIYAARIYMLCKQYEKAKVRKEEIKDIKNWLQIENEYKQYLDLKKRVLDPAEKEINELSDIRIKIEPDKTTRIRKAYRHLIFTIKKATDTPDSAQKKLAKPAKKQKEPEVLEEFKNDEIYFLETEKKFDLLPVWEQNERIAQAEANIWFTAGTGRHTAIRQYGLELKAGLQT